MGIFDRPPQTNPWIVYQLVTGAFEIAREDDYVLGVICVVHSQEDADLVVNALNHYEKCTLKSVNH